MLNYFSKPKKRKVIYRYLILLLLIFPFIEGKAQDQKELNVIKGNWFQFTDAQNSLYHYLANQSYELLSKRKELVSKNQSLSDWQNRQAIIRETLNEIVGPFPNKTPLNVKVSKVINKDGYKVEQTIFESQPGFYVTSSLFIPSGLKKGSKAPAIIYCSGHSEDGYRNPVYQHVILNLVKKGFIVFAFDPVGQGERFEYIDPETGKSKVGDPSREHSYPGAQAFIIGNSQARHMIWDGIRAVDYLVSRKEVDPNRIGITGRSGGGTQSSYIAAFDDRIQAVAPENYITNFTRLFESVGPQDAEQNFPSAILKGIDHPDLLTIRAPKPTLMITTTNDYFSIQGARETAEEVAKVYRAYGKEAQFSMVEDDAPHASTKKNREAMYAFFQKELANPGNSNDEETVPLAASEIQVTATGQVSSSLGGETIYSLNRKEAEKLGKELQFARKNTNSHFSNAVASAKKLSGYQEPAEVDQPVFTGRIQRDGYTVEKYFIRGEGNYVIPYLLFKPTQSNKKVLLYLNPTGKNEDAMVGGEIEWFAKQGFTVLAPDLIGMGEMGPGEFEGDAYFGNTSYNTWFASILVGRSILGIQVGDVIKLVHLINKQENTKEFYGLAKKQTAPILLHAAAIDPLFKRVALIEPYSSYRSIVMNSFYEPSFIHSTVAGSLKEYDLPDLSSSLAPNKLLMIGTTDGLGQTGNLDDINKDLSIVKEVYQKQNAKDKLNILPFESIQKSRGSLLEWLK